MGVRILHFSTDDVTGGAAKAAYRLHGALRSAGHSSQMLVRYKASTDPDVQEAPRLRMTPVRRVKNYLSHFQETSTIGPFNVFNSDKESRLDREYLLESLSQPVDVIYLHWITNFLTVDTIRRIYDRFRIPLVWNLMDLEPVTGGCHYTFGCDRFTKQCGSCPQLTSSGPQDRSRVVWQRKQRLLSDLPITFIANDSWTAGLVRLSSLYHDHRVELIPYAIDTTVFRPVDQRIARDLLHVPLHKKVIFFGSDSLKNPRKGIEYLVDALRLLPSFLERSGLSRQDIFLLVAGREGDEMISSVPFPGNYVGYLHDDLTLALAYQAADIFVCPSVEEAGAMMIPEAMLCKTPVVAFDTGGASDLVETMKTGYLATYKDCSDLANGIAMLLAAVDLPRIRQAAHEKTVNRHAPSEVAARHLELCRSLLTR